MDQAPTTRTIIEIYAHYQIKKMTSHFLCNYMDSGADKLLVIIAIKYCEFGKLTQLKRIGLQPFPNSYEKLNFTVSRRKLRPRNQSCAVNADKLLHLAFCLAQTITDRTTPIPSINLLLNRPCTNVL